MQGCEKCGLFDVEQQECCWFRKSLTDNEVAAGGSNCSYFIETIYEDDEPLTPYQHILLKKSDISRKKMQGPI